MTPACEGREEGSRVSGYLPFRCFLPRHREELPLEIRSLISRITHSFVVGERDEDVFVGRREGGGGRLRGDVEDLPSMMLSVSSLFGPSDSWDLR